MQKRTAATGQTGPRWWAVVAMVIAMALWGFSPVGTRFLVTGVPAGAVLVLRFTLATVVFLPWVVRARVARGDWGRLALAIFLAAGFYIPMTYGLRWVTASTGSLVMAAESILVALAAVWLLGDRPGPRVWLGAAVALVGQLTLTLTLQPASSGGAHPWLGALLVLAGSLSWALHTAVVKPLTARYGAFQLTGILTLGILLISLPLMGRDLASTLLTLDSTAWAAIAVLAVGSTVLGLVLWTVGLRGMSASQAGIYMYLDPLFGVAGGHLMLHEGLTPATLAGGALTLAGVALAQWRRTVTAPAAINLSSQ